MCLVGSTQSSCIIQAQHDSHRAFFVTEVCTCAYFVSFYNFLYYHLHIFPIRLQILSTGLKCSLMGERANAKDYLMNYYVKAAGETPSCALPVWIENRANRNGQITEEVWRTVWTALHWLGISSTAGSWGRPGSARAVKVFLVLICWDSVDTGAGLRDVCALQENKEQSTWRVWGCSFRLLLCLSQCFQSVLYLNNSSSVCVNYICLPQTKLCLLLLLFPFQ